jgi:NADH-quinone oxidoreductase subunit F
MVQILDRIERGQATEEEVDQLLDICDNILGRSFCAFGDGAVSPVLSSIQYFRQEYLDHLTRGGCPLDPELARDTALAGAGSPR